MTLSKLLVNNNALPLQEKDLTKKQYYISAIGSLSANEPIAKKA